LKNKSINALLKYLSQKKIINWNREKERETDPETTREREREREIKSSFIFLQ
jgi:transcription initiation factor IIE alpha subunit